MQIKSKERVVNHGEVFTPDWIVNDMLDLVKNETERVDSRFLEPACGNGNFLAEILRRKLKIVEKRYKKNQIEYEKYSIIAVSSIYGIDLLEDNVKETRERLFHIFNDNYTKLYKKSFKKECQESVKFILKRNILCGDALTLLDKDKNPIIFSEWSLIKDNFIKRRDFALDNLLRAESSKISGSLFEELYENDPAFLPQPIKEYPPIHYLELAKNE